MASILLAACATAAAGEPEPVPLDYRIVPRAFTHDAGLPQSGVNAIVQDRGGYLWLGTFGGLARFDGSTFRIFRERSAAGAPSVGRPRTGPASDRVVSLLEDDRGRLWIGTQDAGLSVLEHGAFRHLPVCGGSCQVSDILQSPDRSIWIATDTGVFRLDADHARATRLVQPGQASYSRLAIDSRGRLFAAGYEGLYVVSGDRLHGIPLPDAGEPYVKVLERDGDGLLVGTAQALYRYRHDDRQWTPQNVKQPAYAVRDAGGRWWVAGERTGVWRETAPGRWRHVPELADVGVTSLARDDEGNLWIGTITMGLLRLRDPLFGLLSAAQLQTEGAGRAVVADGRGGVWLGMACDALRHRDAEGRIRSWPIREVLGNDCVSGLSLDRRGTLWIGAGSVLGRLENGTLRRVASWRDGDSIGLWQADAGRFFVSAGTSTYVLRIDAEGNVLDRRRILALEGMRINQTIPARRGGRWFVGDHGVLRLVGDRMVERWSPQEGLSSRFARTLHESPDGVLWVGTYGGGLNRIVGGRVYRYDSDNGLSDEAVSCILADDRGRLWLGGNRGVTLLPRPRQAGDTIESVLYAANDGLTPSEINGGTSSPCLRDAEGRLWFSLVSGFAMLDPARIPDEHSPPLRVHVEDVEVAGQARAFADGTLPLQSFTRNLQIRYTAINLGRPRETRFRFRLSGFDADWVEAGQNRSILYPTIPWGEHLFEVQARITGGPWSPSARLRIVHPQPWYQRPWIWTLAASMGLLVLVGGTRHERLRPQEPIRRRMADRNDGKRGPRQRS